MSEQKFITGIVLKAFKLKPKKPNSGNRAVAKVRLNNGQIRLGMKVYFFSELMF